MKEENEEKFSMENKNKNWIKRHPVWFGILGIVVLLSLISLFTPSSDTSNPKEGDSFDAISIIKSQILSDMKNKVWYSEEWTQEQLTDTIWKVMSSSSAIWKVSTQNSLCSETGYYVNMCSDNGWAKTYSNLGYCRLDYTCEDEETQDGELSLSLQKEIYYRLIELQDSISFEDKKYSEKIHASYIVIAEHYNLSEEKVEEIVIKGLTEQWPIPIYEEDVEEEVEEESDKATIGEKNALDKAQFYLDIMPFSYSELIEQLEFEGYTYEEAKYGVDNSGADWNEQAALKAQFYLDIMPFSREGLIDQLEFEGFTKEQAEYGVQAVGY